MSNERCPYCIEFYDGFTGCEKPKGHEGPHRATGDDGSECGSDPDDWLPEEIAHKVDFQYINQLLRENRDTRKERDEACQDLPSPRRKPPPRPLRQEGVRRVRLPLILDVATYDVNRSPSG